MHRLPRHVSFAALVFAALLSPSPNGNCADFVSSADAFIDSNHPNNNYGAAGALDIAAPGLPTGEFDTFISFSIGSGFSSIQSISLQLTNDFPNNPIFNSPNAGHFTIEYIPNNSWVEGTGTPKSSDTNAGDVNFTNHSTYIAGAESLGTFSYDGDTSDATQPVYTLTPTADFLNAVEGGGTVSLYLTAADTGVSYVFDSKENAAANGLPAGDNISVQPVLTVNGSAVPEPGPLAGLLAGLAYLAAFRRRSLPSA